MELIVRLGERSERVRIERTSEHYRVEIGERLYQVDSRAIGPFVRSLIVAGHQYEVAILQLDPGRYSVGWRGRSEEVEVLDPLTHLAREVKGGSAAQGRLRVTAYMPGRVVELLVEEGEAVTAGQGLVVLEAMKMQNQIQAEKNRALKDSVVEVLDEYGYMVNFRHSGDKV